MVKNFRKGFNGDYGVKLTPNKLNALCVVDWPVLGVGWPPERSLDKTVVDEVYRVIVGRTGHPNQFPYIDCWQDAVFSQPTWLRPCLEKACRIMVARVDATSKCREKNYTGMREYHCCMCQFIHLYHHHSVPTSEGKFKGQTHL
jgi:hypothetical protein